MTSCLVGSGATPALVINTTPRSCRGTSVTSYSRIADSAAGIPFRRVEIGDSSIARLRAWIFTETSQNRFSQYPIETLRRDHVAQPRPVKSRREHASSVGLKRPER